MFDEAVPSPPTFWGSLYSWFTPTVFFLLLQLVIGTIFIISNLANSNNKHQDPHHQAHDFPHQNQLARSPSVLQRLKSLNFYSYPHRSQSQDPHFQTPTPPNPHHHHHHHHETPQLARSPSMLQRLKSINLYSYFPTEPFSSYTTTHVPEKPHVREDPVVETETDEEEKEEYDSFAIDDIKIINHSHETRNYDFTLEESQEHSSLDEVYSQLQEQSGHFKRQQSDTKPASGELPAKLPAKMKKSASSKSAFSHFKEKDIVETRRPATVREAKVAAVVDDEVDAKADDFINKFKQDLRLQRLDSINKYKEMIGRGAAK